MGQAAFEKMIYFLVAKGLAEQIALHQIAFLHRGQKMVLRPGFHPFRDHLQAERMGHIDEGRADDGGIVILAEVGNKRSIDFQFVQRKLPEVGVSNAPTMCMVVDFPDPDGPMIATKSPL